MSATKVPEGRGRRGLMVWETPPESVLVIRKLDKETVIPFLDLVSWIGLKSNNFTLINNFTKVKYIYIYIFKKIYSQYLYTLQIKNTSSLRLSTPN